jgi:VWFA-related protein
MERKITTATRAVDKFIRSIHQDDDIFLMTFDENTKVRQDFTSDRGKLTKALDGVRLGNGTALFDGLIDGLDKIRKGKHNKKAILLISDGADTSSEHDFNVAMLVTRESEVLVYCLGIAPDRSLESSTGRSPIPSPRNPPTTSPRLPIPGTNFPFPLPIPLPGRRALPQRTQGNRQASMDTIDMSTLDAFAEASGGNSWLISTSDRRSYQIDSALEEIADELRNQYTIGYYPGHELKDGKWHSIDLRTKNRDYDVRAKKEYFGQ